MKRSIPVNRPAPNVQHSAPPRSSFLWNVGLAFFAASALAVVLAVSITDPDLWGHLRFGFDTLRDGAIARTDPYSYVTAGQPWINHEWLTELLFALAWTAGASAGLVALKLAVAGITCGLLYRHLVGLPLQPLRAAILFIPLAAPLLMLYFLMVRPQIFTYLCFTITLLTIRRADSGHYRALWIAPPLLVLWVNLHGGVLAGIGILGLWACVHVAQYPQAFRKVLAPAVASLLALLCTPYGVELPLFLLRTATVPRPEILEWQPMTLLSVGGALYVAVFATAAAGIAFGRPQRRHATPLALLAIVAVLPWLSMRHMPLFSIAAIVFAGEHVAAAWMRAIGPEGNEHNGSGSPLLLMPIPGLAAVAMLVVAYQLSYFTQVKISEGFKLPAASVELLKRGEVSGNLMLDFGWGEYALWHLSPRIRIGMDGRRETVYADRLYEQYLDFHHGTGDWDAILKQHPADFVLVRVESPTRNLMKLEPGWSLVFEDDAGALFVREDSSQAATLKRAASDFRPLPSPKFFP